MGGIVICAPMGPSSGPLYSVWIVPPRSFFANIRVVSDYLAEISPHIMISQVPHISLTGVVVTDETDDRLVAWKKELQGILTHYEPFRIELGKPIRMHGSSFPNNFGVPAHINERLEVLSRLVIDCTHRHFQELKKQEMSPYVDHMYFVQHVPNELKYRVAEEIRTRWNPITFYVDRVYMARIVGDRITRDPILFKEQKIDEDIAAYIPDEYDQRWILAAMFVHQVPIENRIRMHKAMYGLDELEPREHHFHFEAQKLGPWSFPLQETVDKIESRSLISVKDKREHKLTPLGEKVAAQCYLSLQDHERSRIVKWMKTNAHRSTDELLTKVHFEHPDMRIPDRNWPDD
jgi:hypothetical protein